MHLTKFSCAQLVKATDSKSLEDVDQKAASCFRFSRSIGATLSSALDPGPVRDEFNRMHGFKNGDSAFWSKAPSISYGETKNAKDVVGPEQADFFALLSDAATVCQAMDFTQVKSSDSVPESKSRHK